MASTSSMMASEDDIAIDDFEIFIEYTTEEVPGAYIPESENSSHDTDKERKYIPVDLSWIQQESVDAGEKPCKCSVCERDNSDSSTHHNEEHSFQPSKEKKIFSNNNPKTTDKLQSGFLAKNNTNKKKLQYFSGYCKRNVKLPGNLKTMYSCIVCDYVYPELEKLKTHILGHLNDKSFQCMMCDAEFSKLTKLSSHVQAHNGEKSLKCQHCNAVFARISHLKRHELTHGLTKIYKCVLCEAIYDTESNLKNHQVLHDKEELKWVEATPRRNMRKCETCGRVFSRKPELESHKLVHYRQAEPSQVRSQRCNAYAGAMKKCDASTGAMNTSHWRKLKACEACKVVFKDRTQLNRHMLKHRYVDNKSIIKS